MIMGNLAIFASGSGTNANAIIEFFKDSKHQVVLILTNRRRAGVTEIARSNGIPCVYISPENLNDGNLLLKTLDEYQIDFVALAGYLKMIPSECISRFEDRMVNIHPALLPKFGGKGMYGSKVHQEVKESEELVSGITIHYVNEFYDQGKIIFQASCNVENTSSAKDISARVRTLEHQYYPRVIDLLMSQN